MQHFDKAESQEELRQLIREYLATGSTDLPSQHLLDDSFEKIRQAIAAPVETKIISIPLVKRSWFRFSAAAVLLIVASLTVIFVSQKQLTTPSASAGKEIKILTKDIPAGRDNAILTLANGKTIVLDTASNGTVANENGIKIIKINGQIAYQDAAIAANQPLYNQISTGKGNQYQLILADGSRVWLNAASSIRFPIAFAGNERKVEITGETYFEVAKNAAMPFKVLIHSAKGNSEVEVLGTHFNINAYDDEPDIRTTLLEGAVKLTAGSSSQVLSPGQQARSTSTGISLRKDVDVDNVVAWKNGFFVFDNTNLRSLMRQVDRWYDVETEVDNSIAEESFSGKISRDVPLSKFIKVLELNEVQVKTTGRKIMVMP